MGINSVPEKRLKGSKDKATVGGKKKKVFAESLGKEHLLALSHSIADQHSSKLQERVERAKGKAAWEKEKRVKKASTSAVPPASGSNASKIKSKPNTAATPYSKTSIRASLLAKRREKSKSRKEARKMAGSKGETGTSSSLDQSDSDKNAPKTKRVSFA